MTVASAYISGIGLAAPGLPSWAAAQVVLREEQAYEDTALGVYQPNLLPPNERRRASPAVRMAFRVAEEATHNQAASALATTFVSADGDLQIAHRICAALATPERFISPTDFHNSVHNAAAGYWSIATAAQGPSTAISGWDMGFAVGLVEALGIVQVEGMDTLLVAYDLPAPEPLWAKRPLAAPFGVALLLSKEPRAGTLGHMKLEVAAGAVSTLENGALERLRRSNPAARALPLLCALARRVQRELYFDWTNDNTVRIALTAL
jgi:hypothetical protein